MAASRVSTRDITFTAMCTAIIAVFAQITIPMPLGVPMTMQTFAVPFTAIMVGRKRGTAASFIYLLIGLIGVPVFAGFGAGPGTLFGVTGGFLFSFPLMAWCAGKGAEAYSRILAADNKKRGAAWLRVWIGLIAGAVINYAVGVLWFMLITKGSFLTAFYACVLPFIPTSVIKIILAGIAGVKARKLAAL
ncbi:MAG: biotin transporter BioY [Lachnospiraceae bacterium]|nr:biotin transporter BioY [Lachnospiraceae bacterium]